MIEDLYNLGLSLVPYNGGEKYPKDMPGWQRYCRQRASLGQLRQWLRTNDRFGVCCGPASGIVVFDTDTPEGEAWAQANLPETPWIVSTGFKDLPDGEGGTRLFRGRHRYYRIPELPEGVTFGNGLPEGIKAAGLRDHVDLRGDGGQVVAPGVFHSSGARYEPHNWPWSPTDQVPTWPEYLMPRTKPAERPKPRITNNLSDAFASAQKWIDQRDTPRTGSRNEETYITACHMFGFGLSESDVFDLVWNWNCRFAEPLSESEVRRTVLSAARCRQGNEDNPKGEFRLTYKRTARRLFFSYPEPELYPEQQPETDRSWIERSYLVSAWDSETGSQILSSYSLSRWKDPDCRACASAIQKLVNQDQPVEPITIATTMRDAGQWEAYRRLNDFEADLLTRGKLREDSKAAREAFLAATRWDELTQILQSAAAELGKGDPNRVAAELAEQVGTLLSSETNDKIKTVKQVCEKYRDLVAEGEPLKDSFVLPLIQDLTGPLGGGDVVPICGPPKAGKSTLLMELAREAAQAGIKGLISQLELREEQVAERELTALSGLQAANLSQHTAKRLQKELDLAALGNLYITTIGNDIATHKAEIWPILAAKPEIKVWFLDYNERLYEHTVDRNLMASRVAKFVKDTAMMFDVCAVVLLQPNDQYYREGSAGPQIQHIDYGKQWRKDCQWLGFMHHPYHFDKSQKREFVELWTMLSRSTDKRRLSLRWDPELYRFHKWEGAEPKKAQKPAAKKRLDPMAIAANDDTYETLPDVEFDF